MRIDRWLWVARLAKTRALAAEAVTGGRVHVNGRRVKPSRDVRPGDQVDVTIGSRRMIVVVRGTAPRRGPAAEAALLYEETEAGRAAREQLAAQRRMLAQSPPTGPRPTKRDRRRMDAARSRR